MADAISRDEAGLLIDEGRSLLAARRFADAWEVLDRASRLDKRNPGIHTLLGIASVYQEYLDDAREYFEKAVELDRDCAEARCGLSYVLMRQDHVAEATEELCDVLKTHPRHAIARRRFAELKAANSIEAWIAGLHPSMFVALPKAARRWKTPAWFPASKARRVAIGVMLACITLLMFMCVHNKWFFLERHAGAGTGLKPDRYYPASIPLNTDIGRRLNRALQSSSQTKEIFLSDDEVSSLLTRAQALLKSGEHNEARYLLNRLLASNADRVSLDVAKKLDAFVKSPQPERMHYNPEIDDVVEHGALFRGVYVKWLTRVVQRTNQVFLQVSPALSHRSSDRSTRVVVIDRSPVLHKPGATVEVYGEVLGVDAQGGDDRIVFIEGKQMRALERRSR